MKAYIWFWTLLEEFLTDLSSVGEWYLYFISLLFSFNRCGFFLLGIYPLYLSYSMCWHMITENFLLYIGKFWWQWPLHFWLWLLSLSFFLKLANGFTVLFIFLKINCLFCWFTPLCLNLSFRGPDPSICGLFLIVSVAQSQH